MTNIKGTYWVTHLEHWWQGTPDREKQVEREQDEFPILLIALIFISKHQGENRRKST